MPPINLALIGIVAALAVAAPTFAATNTNTLTGTDVPGFATGSQRKRAASSA